MATASDTNMVELISIIESGFPEFHHELPTELHEYHQFRDHLYTVDGVILFKSSTVIPPFLRSHVLTILHLMHQVVTSMTACAKTTVFWPGIIPTITATTWRPANLIPHPSFLSCQHIHSSGYLLTSSTIRVRTTWLWLTDIQTGPSSNRHKQDQRALLTVYDAYLEHLASLMSVRRMVTPSSRHPPLVNSSRIGESTTACRL